MLSMKNYRLAVDENGSPFVLNSKGSIDFGYITEEMNLPAAPIRVAEGLTGPKGYGLKRRLKRVRMARFYWKREMLTIIHCSLHYPEKGIIGR